MNTGNLAKQIVSKIWYYVENPENEQHSGKQLLELINTTFISNELFEINEALNSKDTNRIATIINSIENKLIEDNRFLTEAKVLIKKNDSSYTFKQEQVVNIDTDKFNYSEIVLRIIFSLQIFIRLFSSDRTLNLFFAITGFSTLLIILLKKFSFIRYCLLVILVIFIFFTMVGAFKKGLFDIVIMLIVFEITVIWVIISDIKQENN